MYFEILHARLAASLRERVRNGELTERGLARLLGLSQPHVHHVLKGARTLSPRTADAVLRRLGLTAADLLTAEEAAQRGRREEATST